MTPVATKPKCRRTSNAIGVAGTHPKEVVGETFVLGPEGCGLASETRGLFKKAGTAATARSLSYLVM